MSQVIKAIKLIDIELEKNSKGQLNDKYDEWKQQDIISSSLTIEVPSEFYYSRLVDNMKPSNFDCRFRSTKLNEIHSNLSIIERMLFEENKSIKYVAKWLRIPAKSIMSILRTYFKALKRNKNRNNQKQQFKYQRMLAAKTQIDSFIKSRAGRWISVKMIKDDLNATMYDSQENEYTYSEVYSIMKRILNLSWRKANLRAPQSLNRGLESQRDIFRQFISKLKESGYLIVYIDEVSFSTRFLPMYTWMPKGELPWKVYRELSCSLNAIAAQWGNDKYFMIKSSTTIGMMFAHFIERLQIQLTKRVTKPQLLKRTIYILDNARIHKVEEVYRMMQKYQMQVFSMPPYSPELSRIEKTFGTLKNNISKRNLWSKTFYTILKEEIQRI